MTGLAAAGLASAAMVFLRAMQQLNVVHDRKRWVPPISLAMATCEAVVVVNYARAGVELWLILSTGTGAAIGCLAAMALHRRLRHDG